MKREKNEVKKRKLSHDINTLKRHFSFIKKKQLISI